MAKTVAQLILGADRVALLLGKAATSMVDEFTAQPAQPKDLLSLAATLQAVSKSIQQYSEIYSWCLAQGHTGEGNVNALDELLPHLDPLEKHQLYAWLGRMDGQE